MGGDVAVAHAVLTKIADVEVDVHKGRFRALHQPEGFGPICRHLERLAVESNGTPMTTELGDSDPLWVLGTANKMLESLVHTTRYNGAKSSVEVQLEARGF